MSILEFSLGAENNSRIWPVSWRVCVVAVLSAPVLPVETGAVEMKSFHEAGHICHVTVSTNVADVGSAML